MLKFGKPKNERLCSVGDGQGHGLTDEGHLFWFLTVWPVVGWETEFRQESMDIHLALARFVYCISAERVWMSAARRLSFAARAPSMLNEASQSFTVSSLMSVDAFE